MSNLAVSLATFILYNIAFELDENAQKCPYKHHTMLALEVGDDRDVVITTQKVLFYSLF